MDIQSEDELQDTDFREDNSENHDPKQSSKAPVKGSLKVFEWVVYSAFQSEFQLNQFYNCLKEMKNPIYGQA